MENRSFVDDEVVVDHLSSLKVSVSCGVVDDSIHNEADILRLASSFGDGFSF
jgi:hypothetical protein